MHVARSPIFGPSPAERVGLTAVRKVWSRLVRDRIDVAGLNACAMVGVYVLFLSEALGCGAWMAQAPKGMGVVDFAAFWATGKVVAAGHAAQAYDWSRLRAVLEHAFAAKVPHGLPIYYPPSFLVLTAPLGLLPYKAAFCAWAALGLGAYLAAVTAVSRRWAVIAVALAAPGVLASLMVGQNGLLVAGLLGGGLALLDRRPIAAGLLLGLLAFKPHLALLVPVALVAGGRWRALAAAAASAAALAAAAAVAFGPEVYIAFLHASARAQASFAGEGWLSWAKVQTVYGAVRQTGAPPALGWALQGAASLAAACGVAWLWRGGSPTSLKAAGLAAGVFLATPYAFAYDAPVLGMATVFLFAGREARELSTLQLVVVAAAFVGPMFANPLPLTAPSAAALFALVLWRARPETARVTKISPAPSHPGAPVEASS